MEGVANGLDWLRVDPNMKTQNRKKKEKKSGLYGEFHFIDWFVLACFVLLNKINSKRY